MAINFIKKEDLSHITRTTRQWETTIDRYEIIPKGVLCIELCNDKLTKIKIGNGHLIYEQLPYVSDVNLSDYYTKEETNNLIKDLKAIKIKGEASSLSDLPLRGNEEGDLWFIPKQDPDTHSRYDEYIWYKNKWESFGSSDIDLSEYAKKSYVDTHIQEVQNEITEIIESGYLHKHDNKNILDHTSAVYNVEKDNKLRDLHNYDDTELREKAHTHLNKNILDQTDAVYNRDKDDKLSSLHNYDDTDVKDRISTLEGVAHSHSNQDVLDRTTAAFTREQAITLLDCKDFEGTDGTNDGYHGFVPAPTAADAGKVLGANGQWVPMSGGGGGDTVAEGGGISITTDAQTGNKVIAVNAGTGLSIDPVTGELNADAQALEPATTTTLGGVIIGDGISVDNNGVIDVNTGDGLLVNNDNELEVSVGDGLQIDANGAVEVDTGNGLNINQNDELEVLLGEGLQFDQNGAIEVSVGDGLSINASDEVELKKATSSTLGGVIVGDNIDVNNGTISVPKAASNKLGVVKPTDGLSIDSNGVLTVDTGDGLSIDSTTKEVNVNVGDGLTIDSTNNDINVNTGRALSINSSTKAVDVDIASNSSYGCVKIGEGIDVDQYGIISVDKMVPFRTGNGLELVDESVRLPSGYAKVKYVENPSGAAMVAPFNPRAYPNAKVAVKFSRTSLSSSGNIEYVFGAEIYVHGARYFNLGFFNKTADALPLYAGFVYGSNTWDTQTDANGGRSTDIDIGDIIYAECSVGEGLKMNYEQIHNVTNVGAESLPYIDLGVFADRRRVDQYTIYTEKFFVGRIYSFKIYDGKNVILNLIPAVRLSDNVVGFYSYTNDTFYPSITEVPFTTDMETLDIEVPDWVMNASIATSNSLGVVKPSTGLVVNEHGALTLDKASASTIGGVKVGNNLSIDSDGVLTANIINYSSGHAIEITGDLSIDKFRWEITANAGDSMVAFRYFEYSDSSHIPFTIQSGTIEWSDGSTVSYPSGYDETFDGMMENRTKCTVTGWTGTKTLIMTFRLSQSIMLSDISYFRWKTDDYMCGRQPQEFNIYAHDSINDEWILLKEVTDHTLVPSSSNTWSTYIDIEPEIEPGAINVKYGNGITLNQNNELEVPVASSSTLGGVIVGNGLTVTSDGTISTATGKAYIAGEGINMSSSQYEFSAENEQYLFKSQVTCELHGSFNREFQKYTDDTALGIIWNVYDSGTLWSGPIFVGLSSDSVKYTTNSTTYSALGTFSYLGKTWYYSDHSMYVSNIDGTDHDGNMVVDTGSSASTSELVDFCKSLIDRARVILKVDEISLLPATEDTLGGIKIGEGLSIDENNVVSSTVYEEGQGITFETSGSTDSFDVKNKEYYFDEIISCQISGNFGPRTFTRLSDEPCLMALMKYNTSWCMPIIVGLTAESVDMSQSWDATILHSKGTLDYKGYTWYVNADYGLTNGSMVDLMGNLQTLPDMYTYDTSSYDAFVAKIMDVARDLIDLAELISPGIKTYDVWNTGTGWLQGDYSTDVGGYFVSSGWPYTYHSDPSVYFTVPEGASKVKLVGISRLDEPFAINRIDCFDSSHYHTCSLTCNDFVDIPVGTVSIQFKLKWSDERQTITGSDVKSVTLEIKVPKNNAITAKLGDGLTFDENDAITLDESIKLIIHCVGSPIS